MNSKKLCLTITCWRFFLGNDAEGQRILIVEDDYDIADLVAHYLNLAGYTTEIVNSGIDVLDIVSKSPPDLIVLDLMLPAVSGLEICRQIRTDPNISYLPIIILTAKTEESDRIVGLELGGDDYVTKPFSPKELVSRVGAVLRRSRRGRSSEKILKCGPLVIDIAKHVVLNDGQEIKLTAKEFLLLKHLIEKQGRMVLRDVLLSDVWGYTYTGGTRTLDVHIRRIREKIPILKKMIITVKQFGYKLIDVEAESK